MKKNGLSGRKPDIWQPYAQCVDLSPKEFNFLHPQNSPALPKTRDFLFPDHLARGIFSEKLEISNHMPISDSGKTALLLTMSRPRHSIGHHQYTFIVSRKAVVGRACA
ncbi:hypothetical protein TNCV_2519131 [Trichonephila clavipes]|nr:hypothetical protein TNCV_2519131 [Trichonephila clavipes]